MDDCLHCWVARVMADLMDGRFDGWMGISRSFIGITGGLFEYMDEQPFY